MKLRRKPYDPEESWIWICLAGLFVLLLAAVNVVALAIKNITGFFRFGAKLVRRPIQSRSGK